MICHVAPHRRESLSRFFAALIVCTTVAALPAIVVADPPRASVERTSAEPSAGGSFVVHDPTSIGGIPSDVAIGPGGRRGYVLSPPVGLLKLDLTTSPASVIGSTDIWGSQVVVHPDGKTAYVIGETVLSVIDVARPDPRLVGQVDLDAPLNGMVVAPGGKFLFLAHGRPSGSGVYTLSVKEPRAPKKVSAIAMRSVPQNVAVNRRATRLMVAHRGGAVTVVDVSNRRQPHVIKRFAMPFRGESSGRTGRQLAVSGAKVYVFGDTPARLIEIDLTTNQIVRRRQIGAGSAASHIASGPGGLIYMTAAGGRDDPTVFVVDAATFKTLGRLNGFYFPGAIAISRRSPTKGRGYFLGDVAYALHIPPLLHAVERA